MRYKRRNPGEDPRVSEPDIYIIDPHTHERRVMSGVEAANYAVVLQGLIVEDPINYDKERTRASLTWHINHALRMGYDWDTLKVRLSKAKKGERSNPRRRKNPDEPKWLSDARKRKKETGDPGEWFISLHDDDSGYVAHSDYFTGSREQARKRAAYYADDLIDTLRPGFNVKAYVYDPTTESTRPIFVVAPSRVRVAAKEKARRLAEATLHGDWDEVHRIRTGRSVKGRRASK